MKKPSSSNDRRHFIRTAAGATAASAALAGQARGEGVPSEKKLKVDSTKSSSGRSSGSVESAPIELGSTEGLKLRIFVDKSIIEVFANSRQAIARHIFPENENSTGVKVFSKNADTLITKFESWQIAPSNPY